MWFPPALAVVPPGKHRRLSWVVTVFPVTMPWADPAVEIEAEAPVGRAEGPLQGAITNRHAVVTDGDAHGVRRSRPGDRQPRDNGAVPRLFSRGNHSLTRAEDGASLANENQIHDHHRKRHGQFCQVL
jgi:hypothetical protein